MKKNLQNDSKYNKEFAKADSLFLTNKRSRPFGRLLNCDSFYLFKFSFAVANISLIRFNWFTSLAPGS